MNTITNSCKPIIAIDIDEVLAQFIPSLADFHNELYGTSLQSHEFTSYYFHEVWGGSIEETQEKIIAFFQSQYIHDLEPVEAALDALLELKEHFCLHVITARQLESEDLTRAWIGRNYPDIFEEIHFGNHFSSTGLVRSKSEICKSINALLLVDDSHKYVVDCALNGIPSIKFGSYPWNRGDLKCFDKLAADNKWLVKEASHWDEVVDLIFDRFNIAAKIHLHSHQFTIAMIQMCSVGDKTYNLSRVLELMTQAVTKNEPKLICLPECCAFIGNTSTDVLSASEILFDENGMLSSNFISEIAKFAANNNVYVSVGGFPEKIKDEQKIHNSHIFIERDGKVHPENVYRKLHLFDNPLTGLQESKSTKAGNHLVTVSLHDFNIKIGLSTCYDVRFPELYRALCQPTDNIKLHDLNEVVGIDAYISRSLEIASLDYGADVILIPSAFTVTTGRAHWETLLRARAIENQVYVIAAAQCGKHNDTRESYGHSMAIDPWGEILAHADSTTSKEAILYVTIDRKCLQHVRQNMPVWIHRRNDVIQ